MQQINLDDAKTHLPELVKAALQGEEILILTDEQQAVQLVPVEKTAKRPQFGSAKGWFIMSDDFDEPLEDFADYM